MRIPFVRRSIGGYIDVLDVHIKRIKRQSCQYGLAFVSDAFTSNGMLEWVAPAGFPDVLDGSFS